MSHVQKLWHSATAAAAVIVLSGCASNIPDRLAMVERHVQTLGRNDAEFERAMRAQMALTSGYENQLVRIEKALSRQMNTNAEMRQGIDEALALTRRVEIQNLGGSPLFVVKP